MYTYSHPVLPELPQFVGTDRADGAVNHPPVSSVNLTQTQES